jgi:hypothetical protein
MTINMQAEYASSNTDMTAGNTSMAHIYTDIRPPFFASRNIYV